MLSPIFLYIIHLKQLFSKKYTDVISWQILPKFSLTNAKCVEVGCYNLHIIVLPLIAKLYEDYEEKLKTVFIWNIQGKIRDNEHINWNIIIYNEMKQNNVF